MSIPGATDDVGATDAGAVRTTARQVLDKVVNGDISWLPDGFDGHDRTIGAALDAEPGSTGQAALSTLQGTVAGVRGRGRRRHSRPSVGSWRGPGEEPVCTTEGPGGLCLQHDRSLA